MRFKTEMMNRRVWKSAVGFLTLAGSLAMTVPASATLWRNNDVRFDLMYLTIPNGASAGQGTFDSNYNGLTTQHWSAIPDPAAPGFFRIVSLAPRFPQLVLDIPNSDLTRGTRVNVYTINGGANQSWQPVFMSTDPQGASCYTFHSRLSNDRVLSQQGNVGSPTDVITWNFVPNYIFQVWCAYSLDSSGNIVPQNPPPF